MSLTPDWLGNLKGRVDCVGEDVGEKWKWRREQQAMIVGRFGVWKKLFECGCGQK